MALAADMNQTISLIKNFWPDLKFDKSDVVKGNPNFVVNFYSTFIAEFEDKMSYLLNTEIINEFDDIQDFEPEVVLYCKVARVLRKMESLDFVINLGDFYFPNPKKMYQCIKVSIHFVVFINNNLDKVSDLLNKNLKKLIEFENLKDLKQQHMQENVEFAEKYGETLRDSDFIKDKHEEVKKEYENYLADKEAEEKLIAEMITDKSKLITDVDNYEYELKLLEDKENNLLDNVISQEEYENLLSTEKYLQFEQEQLEDSIEIEDKKVVENVEQFEEFARVLSDINLDILPVENIHEFRITVKAKNEKLKQLQDDIENQNKLNETEKKRVDELKKKLEETKNFHKDFTEQMQVEENEAKKNIAFEIEKSAGYFQLIQQRKTAIFELKDKMQQIDADQYKLLKEVAKQYERILNVEKKATNNFHNMLKRFGEH